MLLNRLLFEEKQAFVSLCIYAAEANDSVVEEEYDMIEAYCKEMGISFFDARKVMTLDEIVEVLKKSSYSNKKVIILEMLGLLYADGVYDGDENSFIVDFTKKIGVDIENIDLFKKLIEKYIVITNEIIEAVE